MNKMIKGSVAGATGIALLMGGFGTYALWSDSEGLDSGTVQSGTLDILNVANATWEDVSTDATSSAWAAGTDLMVPGDTVEMTRAVTMAAEGKNLQVDFELGGLPVSTSWAALDVSATYGGQALTRSVDDGGTPADTTDDTYVFGHDFTDPDDLDGVNDLVVSFEFEDVTGTAQQDRTVSLADLTVSITQHRP